MRLDKHLVELGLAPSRTMAQRLIKAGAVEANTGTLWRVANKASEVFPANTRFRINGGDDIQRFVSRAGLKLDHALNKANINVEGMRVLDIGQSTGGFTDCVLKRGAASVVGVDVGREQLHPQLKSHPHITCLEGINARELHAHQVGENFDVIVMDVSFISQTLILPKLALLLVAGGRLVSLVKPQFEVGAEGVSKGGLVRDASLYQKVEQKIRQVLDDNGFQVTHYFDSPIRGGDGNREFFIVARNSV